MSEIPKPNDIKTVFEQLSGDDPRKLLIGLVNFAENGGSRDAVIQVCDINVDDADETILELIQLGLLEKGILQDNHFVVSDNGGRVRLVKSVKEQIKKDLLGLKD